MCLWVAAPNHSLIVWLQRVGIKKPQHTLMLAATSQWGILSPVFVFLVWCKALDSHRLLWLWNWLSFGSIFNFLSRSDAGLLWTWCAFKTSVNGHERSMHCRSRCQVLYTLSVLLLSLVWECLWVSWSLTCVRGVVICIMGGGAS